MPETTRITGLKLNVLTKAQFASATKDPNQIYLITDETDLTLEEIQSLIDQAIDDIPTPDVSGQISAHNTSSTAHSDIRTALSGKANDADLHAVAKSGDYNALENLPTIPTTLPASDVHDWAKAENKPTYTATEVGAAVANHTHSQYLPFNDTYCANCNEWLTNGYIKTGANQTNNLPSVCTGADRWGVLFFVAENLTSGTGTQMYFPIDGTYKGRVFVRSLTNMLKNGSSVGGWTMLATTADIPDITSLTSHTSDTTVHITADERTSWNGAATNSHTHSNKTVLDGVTEAKVTNWDNAHAHAGQSGNPHGTTKTNIGLGNVPNVSTNDQTPTFTQASSRANIASGEKLSVILGKIMKWFADLKTVAFTGAYSDLSGTPDSLPASDVSSWAKAESKPTYTASEVGADASGAAAGVQGNLNTHTGNATVHITAAERAKWNKSITSTVSATLAAASWSGTSAPYTQIVSVAGVTADKDGMIALSQNATADQREAARSAGIEITGQAANSITVAAYGDKPTVDIPATVILIG